MPAWIIPIVASFPMWVQWLVPAALQILVNYVLPAVAKAMPAEAVLVNDIIAWLSGKPVPVLMAAHAHYHSLKAAEMQKAPGA